MTGKRDMLLAAITEAGEIASSKDLLGVGGIDNTSDLHSLLYGMQKGGIIKFRESHNGSSSKELRRIRLVHPGKDTEHVESTIPQIVEVTPPPIEEPEKPRKPHTHTIVEWLKQQKPDDKGWVMITTGELAGQANVEVGIVSGTINNLEKQGVLEVLRLEEGQRKRIIGLRTAEAASAEKQNRIKEWKTSLYLELPPTPLLDDYELAKQYAARYDELTLKPNPQLEEALTLKEHLTNLIATLKKES